MTLHALTIAKRSRWADRGLKAIAMVALVGGCGGQADPETEVPSTDQSWVASACQPTSVDTAGWTRHRLGDLTIMVPPEYRMAPFEPYTLGFRTPGASVRLYLHRNAIYLFDAANRARRGQNWCQGTLGGYQAEIVAWREQFRGANFNFAARLRATWGGQDEGKWLFVSLTASRLRDAQRLRDALHTIDVVRTPGPDSLKEGR